MARPLIAYRLMIAMAGLVVGLVGYRRYHSHSSAYRKSELRDAAARVNKTDK